MSKTYELVKDDNVITAWALYYMYHECANNISRPAEVEVINNLLLWDIPNDDPFKDVNKSTIDKSETVTKLEATTKTENGELDSPEILMIEDGTSIELELSIYKRIKELKDELKIGSTDDLNVEVNHTEIDVTFYHELSSIFYTYYTKYKQDQEVRPISEIIISTYIRYRGYLTLEYILVNPNANINSKAVNCDSASSTNQVSVGTIDMRRYVHAAFIDSLTYPQENCIFDSRFNKYIVNNRYSLEGVDESIRKTNINVLTRWVAPKNYANRIERSNFISEYLLVKDAEYLAQYGGVSKEYTTKHVGLISRTNSNMLTYADNLVKLNEEFNKHKYTELKVKDTDTQTSDVIFKSNNFKVNMITDTTSSITTIPTEFLNSDPLGYTSVEYDVFSNKFYVVNSNGGLSNEELQIYSSDISDKDTIIRGKGRLDKFISLGSLDYLNQSSILADESTMVFTGEMNIQKTNYGATIVNCDCTGTHMYDWLSDYELLTYGTNVSISNTSDRSSHKTKEVMYLPNVQTGTTLSPISLIYTKPPGFRNRTSFGIIGNYEPVDSEWFDRKTGIHRAIKDGVSYRTYANMSHINCELYTGTCQVARAELEKELLYIQKTKGPEHLIDYTVEPNRPIFETFRHELYHQLISSIDDINTLTVSIIKNYLPIDMFNGQTLITLKELLYGIDIIDDDVDVEE